MGQTSDNRIRTRNVENLPFEGPVTYVDQFALTTDQNSVPEKKRQWSYCYEPDKLGIAGFIPVRSESVAPPRAREGSVQMEAIVQDFPSFQQERVRQHARGVRRETALPRGPAGGGRRAPYPVRWRPLIMSFCRFFWLQ